MRFLLSSALLLASFALHSPADPAPAAASPAPAAAAVAPAPTPGGFPVINDYEIEHKFTKGLSELVEKNTPLHGLEAIRKAIKEATGHTARVPVVTPPAGGPPACEKGVFIVGTIYKCKDCDEWHTGGMASGWAVSADGLIVTNHHVVNLEQEEENAYLGVMDRAGHVLPVKEVVADNKDTDIAVIRVEAKDCLLHPLPLAPAAPASGTPVSVISHPDGRYYCLSKGHVTRHHLQPADDNDIEKAMEGKEVPMVTWMSISADFGVGSSGAPVLDDQGRVVGMVSLTCTVIATENEDEDENPPATGVQMVFKDCVPVPALRAMIQEEKPK